MKRREFLTVAGVSAFALNSSIVFAKSALATDRFKGYAFPDLPYSFNALEPAIDSKALRIHYTQHHRNYYEQFMRLISGTDAENLPPTELFAKISQYGYQTAYNAGGFFNHNLFWENLSPYGGGISGELLQAITSQYGSIENLKELFQSQAINHQGSGWGWLVLKRDGQIAYSITNDNINPLMDIADERGTPILAMDLWEHAYFSKYYNNKGEYIKSVCRIVDWGKVSERYSDAIQKRSV